MPATTAMDPYTGAAVHQRAGLTWVPRGEYLMQPAYVANYVPQTVSQTSYVPRVVCNRFRCR